ncbi:hypothetical protein EV182_002558 [Spiromyces aspiralis]|uniref:Uncharacterized protein n=1 Tax=Spiromyces aspiralis TaxID=68401 RepID=A0ACC1HXT7_9FUNG|nr:hypothetical protein EV182_002558 [Spiromyces aspiralis]
MSLRVSDYLAQKASQDIDKELMSPKCGFVVEQLMELAGLSVAQAVCKEYPVATTPRVLVCVGPGNNGGDGLVAARHLAHFGYSPSLLYPKQPNKELYQNLLLQCRMLNIRLVEDIDYGLNSTDLIIDAIFGVSFSGAVREPFGSVINKLKQTTIPIVSIDVPSGWDVEKGNLSGVGFEPEMLVSLTAPKECAKLFKGKYHYVGGRFIPP